MSRFSRDGDWLSTSWITGPTHNRLSLRLSLVPSTEAPTIESSVSEHGCGCGPVHEQVVLSEVQEAIEQARKLGHPVHVTGIRFLRDDSRREGVYRHLAKLLIKEFLREGSGRST